MPEKTKFDSLKTVSTDYKLIDNEKEAITIRDFFLTKQILSIDTETTSTDPIDAELVGLSFAVEEKRLFMCQSLLTVKKR